MALENIISITSFSLSAVFLTLSLSLNAESNETLLELRIVPEEDFKDVLSNSAVTINDERTGQIYTYKFYKDGTVTSKRNDEKWKGVWFVTKKVSTVYAGTIKINLIAH